MRTQALMGAVGGEVQGTTIAGPQAARPRDEVDRLFAPLAHDRLWVADIIYVSTWSGWVWVAFVIDAYARRIIGRALRIGHVHPAGPRRPRAGGVDR